MKRGLLALAVALSCVIAGTTAAHATQNQPPQPARTTATGPGSLPAATPGDGLSLTPYDPAHYVDLYADPAGPINGSTYIFNPTADFQTRLVYDLDSMRAAGVNTVGFYNLVQMTDADRNVLFDRLERNRQKAAVRIEWYDNTTFNFDDGDPTFADVASVLHHYDGDDPVHGYTALLTYLIRNQRLGDVAYFAVNMPVDDGAVASHFAGPQYPDGRANPRWAASQVTYADRIVAGLRAILGPAAQLYLSVFYGWDQSYPTPAYLPVAHPADGYFLNNYSYPIGAPPDEHASTSDRLNQPRLQSAMDRMVAQYPTQPKIIEYGLHTAEFSDGVVPNQTAGLMATMAAKRLALAETSAYYAGGSSAGVPFNVHGTMYFAHNLYKEEGSPPAVMDWTLDYPWAGTVEAEHPSATRSYEGGTAVPTRPVAAPGASGGKAVALRRSGSAIVFDDLAAASAVQIRYRASRSITVAVSGNGAAPRTVRLSACGSWRTVTVHLDAPLQAAVSVRRTGGSGTLLVDWLRPMANYEAELATGRDTRQVRLDVASDGSAVTMAAGRTGRLAVEQVRAGSQVLVRYAAASPTALTLTGAGPARTVELPATGGAATFADATVPVAVAEHATLALTHAATAATVTVDYLRVDGRYEAESTGGLYNGGHAVADPRASGGAYGTSFDVVGASVVFTQVMAGHQLTFRYRADRDASMTVIFNGQRRLAFPTTHGAFAEVTLPIDVPAHTTVIVQRNAGDQALGLDIDALTVSG